MAVTILGVLDVFFRSLLSFFHHRIKIRLLLHSAYHKTFADYFILKKVYAKVGALRRLRKLVPADIALMLYKAYILQHLEYRRPLQLGINKTLN